MVRAEDAPRWGEPLPEIRHIARGVEIFSVRTLTLVPEPAEVLRTRDAQPRCREREIGRAAEISIVRIQEVEPAPVWGVPIILAWSNFLARGVEIPIPDRAREPVPPDVRKRCRE